MEIPHECDIITAFYVPCGQFFPYELCNHYKYIELDIRPRCSDFYSPNDIFSELSEANSLEYTDNFSESVTIDGREYIQVVPGYPFIYCHGPSHFARFTLGGEDLDTIHVQGIKLSVEFHERMRENFSIPYNIITSKVLVNGRKYLPMIKDHDLIKFDETILMQMFV